MIDFNVRAERMGWLPSAPQLQTNPMQVVRDAQAAGMEAKAYAVKALKDGSLKMSCEDPDHRPVGGAHIDDRGGDPHRRTAVFAEEAHQPRIGLHHRVVAGAVAQRPHGAERAEITEDEARLRGGEVGGAEPVAVERAEFEVVQDDIGAFQDQRLEPRRVCRVGEVDRDAALSAVDRVEAGRRPFEERRSPTAAGQSSTAEGCARSPPR